MSDLDIIRRLHAHRRWSNQKLRTAATGLSESQLRQSFDLGQGSLWATLVHLYAAEHIWLEAIQGNPKPSVPRSEAFETLEQLNIAWEAQERRWQRHVEALTPVMLDQPVRKVSSSSGAGKMWATPLADVLLHVCMHAHYTAAQATNMFRHLGAETPDLQLITMSRAEHAGQTG